MRNILIVALVLGLGAFGFAGCASDGGSGGGATGTVAVPTGKHFAWSGELLQTTTNVSKYTLVFAKSIVPQPAAAGRWVIVLDKDPNTPANVQSSSIALTKQADGNYTATLNLSDGTHTFYGAYVNSVNEVVEENGVKVRFDLAAWLTGTFRVSFSQAGIRVVAYQAELWPEPIEAVSEGKQSSGNDKFTLKLSKKRFPTVSGNGGWAIVPDGAPANAWAASSLSDGRYAFSGELAGGNHSLAFRWLDGGNPVQNLSTGKPYMPDFSVWDTESYGVQDGALAVSVYKGDLTRQGGKVVPGRPGNEGHGDLKWNISFDGTNPVFHMFARLPKAADGHSWAANGDWQLAATAEAMLQADWYPGWYQPRSLLTKIPWDEDRTIQVLDMQNGVSQRNIEFTGNEFTKTGQPHLINVVASGKAFIAPKAAAVTSAAGPPVGSLTSLTVSENPVHVLPTGQPKVTRTLLANVTVNSVSYAINFSYHADITWQQGRMNSQNTWEPAQPGTEIAVVTRGTVFEGKTGFGQATFRITLTIPNNNYTTDVEVRVY